MDWTDDRLDHLSQRIDERFDQVDRRFEEVDRRFEEIDRRFEGVDQRFDRLETDVRDLRSEMNARFDSLQRTMLFFSGSMTVALLGVVATHA